MTVLFDLLGAQPNTVGSKFHGGGEYSKTVFKALVDNIGNHTLIVFFDKELFMDDWILALIKENNIRVYYVKEYNDLAELAAKERIDVYFSGMPYKMIGKILPEDVRKIGTFHGLRALECPTDTYEYKYRTGYKSLKSMIKPLFRNKLKEREMKSYVVSMEEYNDIVCVSNHTRYAIANYYPNLKKQPTVFYTPAKYLEKEIDEREPLVKGKYILLMGLNRWEKNACRGIMAIENLFDKGLLEEYRVVTIGQISPKIYKIMKHKTEYLEFGYVAPWELENLYANCDFFLYPSLNEGFGMPPLEAMRYGKTCIVSGVCSLPEVCGDAVYYCNPYDIDEIQNRILMASEKKIDSEKILNHFHDMVKRQNQDLQGLCLYILNENIKE